VVLPGVEAPGEWEDHFAAVAGSLRPTSYVEEQLVERIALQLWRLRRAARAEQAAALVSLPRIFSPSEDELARLEEALAQKESVAEVLRALREGRDGAPLADDEPMPYGAQEVACEAVGIVGPREVEGLAQTAGAMRALLRRLAELRGARDGGDPDPAAALDAAIAHAEADALRDRGHTAEVERRIAAYRVAAVAGEHADLICRYEVSVERSLFRTLALLRLERENAPLEGALVEAVPPTLR